MSHKLNTTRPRYNTQKNVCGNYSITMIINPVWYTFVWMLHKQQVRQHRWMAAAAAATGKSCGSARAPDKQQQQQAASKQKQRPPFPPAASVSAMGSPGPVAHSSGSAWPCRVRYPSERQPFSPTELVPYQTLLSGCGGSICWSRSGCLQAFAVWWEGCRGWLEAGGGRGEHESDVAMAAMSWQGRGPKQKGRGRGRE